MPKLTQGEVVMDSHSAPALHGRGNFAVGFGSLAEMTTGDGNMCLGVNAGADLTTECGVIIIGDGIRNLDPAKNDPDTLFLGQRVAIGDTLFGQPCNLKTIVMQEMKAPSWAPRSSS